MPAIHAVMAAVPRDRCDYRPDPASKSALGLARHIALEDAWLLAAVADGRFSAGPDESDACGLMTPADVVAYHQKAVPPQLARVRALSGDDLLRTVDMFAPEASCRRAPLRRSHSLSAPVRAAAAS